MNSHDDQQKSKILHNSTITDIDMFVKTCNSTSPITDKITAHRYGQIYGEALIPYIRRKHHIKNSIKFLEIGLGCDMVYGPGASVNVWSQLLNSNDELWMADYDGDCVNKNKDKLKDIHVLVGDQGNIITLNQWIEKSKGGFDIIIDDGGHKQNQIIESFTLLWPHIKPGGLYFIEDLQVAEHTSFRDMTGQKRTMIDYIHKWNKEMLLWAEFKGIRTAPPGIAMISCQTEACVFRKCGGNTLDNTQFCT